MIFGALGQLALGEVPDEGATPQGWQSSLSTAPRRAPLIHPEIRAFGVTVAAAAAFTTFGWHTPLSKAASQPPVCYGSTFVPFNTRQVNTVTIDKWQVPLSKAVPIAQAAPQGGATWVGQPLAGNNVDLSKWQVPLSRAAASPPVQAGSTFVPFNTAQVIPPVYGSTFQPLSTAAPARSVQAGSTFVPLNTAQVVVAADKYGWWQPASRAPAPLPAAQSELRPFGVQLLAGAVATEGWQAPLSRPAPQPPVQLGSTFVPFNTAQIITAVYGGAFPPLSQAVPIPRVAPAGSTFVPYNTVQIVPAVYGWQQPLSIAVPARLVQLGSTFVPLDTRQIVAGQGWLRPLEGATSRLPRPSQQRVAIAFPNPEFNVAWLPPLSRAVTIPQAPAGSTFVPFNTTQVAPIDRYGWWQPASVAPPPRPQILPELRPFGIQQIAGAVATEGWQRPLSIAAPVPPVWQGNSFVPYNTAQVVVTPPYGWARPLSQAAPQPPVALGSTFVPLNTAQIAPAVYGWWQPLSVVARAIPYPAQPGDIAWIGRPLAGNNVEWGNYQQPLSRPAALPPVWQGVSLVPFNTAQVVIGNTVDYSTYQQPLSRAVAIPYTTTISGYIFVPFDTAQVTPPPAAAAHFGHYFFVDVGNLM